ncbi:hypothetical protein [Flammeovirga pacifica]|uniref:Uncharacterized protein n=1 Tax=Flammeovirga pacifica TaxID=915059 RepID=A0A1S1YSM8_FLAPC|nr:hypothetical protein [Flammeovirga pacifica]OHX63873.1 hypothetical protein NH26_19875 [Flammeovirga pacifica]
MKKLLNNIIKLFALLLVVSSCQKDRELPDEAKVRAIAWAISEDHQDTLEINIDNYISFMDVSQGLLFHQWEIEDSLDFLSGDFNTSTEDYVPYIDQGKGKKTDDITVHVLFQEAGIHKVRLYNTYDRKVKHNGLSRQLEAVPHETDPGIWVIDTTFNVDVYADLAPAFYVLKNDTDTVCVVTADQIVDGGDDSDWATVQLVAGEDKLTFVDTTSVGRPTDREWNLAWLGETSKNRVFEIVPMKTGWGRAGSLSSIRQGSTQGLTQNTSKPIPLNLNVTAPVIEPQYEVYKDGMLIFSYSTGDNIPDNTDQWMKVDLKINETLTYVDKTVKGLTNAREFTLNNAEQPVYTDETSDVVYPEIKSYFEAGTFAAIRTAGDGFDEDREEVKIPLMIRVDEALLKTSDLIENEMKKITFETSIPVATIGANAANAFTVKIKNINGYDVTSTISSVEVDPGNSAQLILTVGEQTYNSDMITVAYDGSADIQSATGNKLEAFDTEMVIMNNPSTNEFENPEMISFELEGNNQQDAFARGWWVDNSVPNGRLWKRTTDKASAGSASMSLIVEDRAAQGVSKLFSIHNEHNGGPNNNGMKNPAGDYEVTFDIFIPVGVDFTSGLQTNFQDLSNGGDDKQYLTPDLSNVEKGKWVTITQHITFDKDGGRRQVSLVLDNPVPATGRLEFYVDNIVVRSIELRP